MEENKISFNRKIHVFNVQGTHDVRVVSLYPKKNVAIAVHQEVCVIISEVTLSLGAQKTGLSKESGGFAT